MNSVGTTEFLACSALCSGEIGAVGGPGCPSHGLRCSTFGEVTTAVRRLNARDKKKSLPTLFYGDTAGEEITTGYMMH